MIVDDNKNFQNCSNEYVDFMIRDKLYILNSKLLLKE